MPGIGGIDQLSDDYTGDSENSRERRLFGVLRSLRLPREDFIKEYSIDVHSFSWDRFKLEGDALEIIEENSNYIVGRVVNTRPRKIIVVYGDLENLGYIESGKEKSHFKKQIKSAIKFSKYLDSHNVRYSEEPSKKELFEKLKREQREISGLAKLLE